MTELGVTEGCTVEVGLSNDVTPKIYRVIEAALATARPLGRFAPQRTPAEGTAEAAEAVPVQSVDVPQRPTRRPRRRHPSAISHQPSDISHQASKNVMRMVAIGAAMVCVGVLLMETGLIIPVGVAGLLIGGVLK